MQDPKVMTLPQIRNQIQALQRKYARELAIYRLRRLFQELSDEWAATIAPGRVECGFGEDRVIIDGVERITVSSTF